MKALYDEIEAARKKNSADMKRNGLDSVTRKSMPEMLDMFQSEDAKKGLVYAIINTKIRLERHTRMPERDHYGREFLTRTSSHEIMALTLIVAFLEACGKNCDATAVHQNTLIAYMGCDDKTARLILKEAESRKLIGSANLPTDKRCRLIHATELMLHGYCNFMHDTIPTVAVAPPKAEFGRHAVVPNYLSDHIETPGRLEQRALRKSREDDYMQLTFPQF